jgi:hypothetical protein
VVTPIWAYWLLVALLVVLLVCVAAIAYQRDAARLERDLYRSALLRVDPHAAFAVAEVLHPTSDAL